MLGVEATVKNQFWCDENVIAFCAGRVGALVEVLSGATSGVHVVIPVENDVFDAWTQPERDLLWSLVESSLPVVWLFMTRKAERVMLLVPFEWDVAFPQNVWVGVEARVQPEADAMLRSLVRVPAHLYVAAASGVDLSNWLPLVDEVGAL